MLPESLRTQLIEAGITDFSEPALREALEARVETYTLIKLAPWASRRWKCRYRLMMGDALYDAQSVIEAYALGIQAAVLKPPAARATEADGDAQK
jgi:hypothetical protein